MAGGKFPKSRRLSGIKAYSRVFGGRHSAGTSHLVVYAMPNDLPYCRYGLTVSRKCGNAVVRNRIKRLLREALRMEDHGLPSGFDLICIPRTGSVASLETYRAAIRSAVKRAVARCKGRPKRISRRAES